MSSLDNGVTKVQALKKEHFCFAYGVLTLFVKTSLQASQLFTSLPSVTKIDRFKFQQILTFWKQAYIVIVSKNVFLIS